MTTPRATRRLIGALATAGLTAAMMQTLVLPLLPGLPGLLSTDTASASWVATSTLIVGAVASPVLGRCGDLYGKRPVLVLVFASLVVGSVICALSESLAALIVGRSVQGLALGVVPLAIGLARDALDRAALPGATARITATIGIGSGIGVPLAGLTLRLSDWHALFWGSAALAVIAGILVFLYTPRGSRADTRLRSFDLPGAALLSVVVVSGLIVVTQGSTWGWGSGAVIGCLLLAIVALAGWLAVEWFSPTPFVDLSILRTPAVAHAHFAVLILGFTMFANYVAVIQLLQLPASTGFGLGRDVLSAGLALLPAMATMIAGSMSVPRLVRRIGVTRSFALGCIASALGYSGMLLWHHELWLLAGWAAVAQAGAGICIASLPLLLLYSVPADQMSASHGFNNMLRFIGAAVGSAVFGALATIHRGVDGLPGEATFTQIWSVALALSILLTVLNAFASPSRRRQG